MTHYGPALVSNQEAANDVECILCGQLPFTKGQEVTYDIIIVVLKCFRLKPRRRFRT